MLRKEGGEEKRKGVFDMQVINTLMRGREGAKMTRGEDGNPLNQGEGAGG